MSRNIPEFLRGFMKPKPTPIQQGDWIKHTGTGEISRCLSIHQGLCYGRTSEGKLTVATIENVEKI